MTYIFVNALFILDLDIFKPSDWITAKHDKPVYFQNITPYPNIEIQNIIANSKIAKYYIEGNITVKSNQCLCAFLSEIKLIDCKKERTSNHVLSFCETCLAGTLSTQNLHGYPLSHYLFIRQITKRFGQYKLPFDDKFTRKLCYLMLKDAKTILTSKTEQNRDLYLENGWYNKNKIK